MFQFSKFHTSFLLPLSLFLSLCWAMNTDFPWEGPMKQRTKSSRAGPDGSSNGHLASTCLCRATSLLPYKSASLQTTQFKSWIRYSTHKSDVRFDRAIGRACAKPSDNDAVNHKFPPPASVASMQSPLQTNGLTTRSQAKKFHSTELILH